MKMLFPFLATISCSVALAPALAQDDKRSAGISAMATRLQQSHIDGNVPAAADFQRFLRRDVSAYLARNGTRASSLAIDLLRDSPTQSGVGFPKYYIWVRATTAQGAIIDGAMRVAAVERTHFDILQFATKTAIREDVADLPATFPAALIPSIEARARR